MASAIPLSLRDVKSLTFDLMGTCADWRSALLARIEQSPLPPHIDAEDLIAAWRAGFFEKIFELHENKQEMSVDEVHKMVLDRLLDERNGGDYGKEQREALVWAWHKQIAWRDAIDGISRLKKKFDCVVVANGTSRLQLDIASSSGLPFHALFSSQLLGHTKPDPGAYARALELLDRKPEEVAMVAAHAYDLRAAKKLGMRTIYIWRDTEDRDEDFDVVRQEVDLFVDGRSHTGPQGGLAQLATILGL